MLSRISKQLFTSRSSLLSPKLSISLYFTRTCLYPFQTYSFLHIISKRKVWVLDLGCMWLVSLLFSRAFTLEKWSFPQHGNYLLSRSFATQAAASNSVAQNHAAEGNSSNKIFASYSVYKGKAALSASPRLPTFAKLESGGVKVDRKGTIMLTFWPAIGERKYDWEKKQLFALSATEVGSLINLGPQDSCEFFHDPAMLSSNAGQVRKSLSIRPHTDGSGYFFSLSVVNNILKTNERMVVPVSSAEFAVMRTAFSFALPRIMGWDQYNNQQVGGITNSNSSKVLPHLIDSEWER